MYTALKICGKGGSQVQYYSAIDIIEDDIEKTDKVLLGILLMDKTTQKNIIWGTNDYSSLGEHYEAAN